MPVMISECSLSATASIASRRRRMRSVRQSLAQLHRRAHQVALVLVELRLEALEQREGIGGAAGEAGEDAVLVQAPHFARAALDDHVARA